MSQKESLRAFCKAKLNLTLAVTGRREDGFHNLVSVVAPIEFADELTCRPLPAGASADELLCAEAEVPTGPENLVRVAADAFRAHTGSAQCFQFELRKRIPAGAGLGGGSSDATQALRLLNEWHGRPLAPPALADLASQVGSDCPLFLEDGPVIMRGRGERVARLGPSAEAALTGRSVVVFKPLFGVATGWAYGQLAASPEHYVPEAEAEASLASWLRDPTAALPLHNNLEAGVFAKFAALPTLLERIHADVGCAARMTGSGSACFALPESADQALAVIDLVRWAWGDEAFVCQTRLGRSFSHSSEVGSP